MTEHVVHVGQDVRQHGLAAECARQSVHGALARNRITT